MVGRLFKATEDIFEFGAYDYDENRDTKISKTTGD